MSRRILIDDDAAQFEDIKTRLRRLESSNADKINFQRFRSGQGTVTWPGGSPLSSALTVPHGLGAIPVSITDGTTSTGIGAFFVFHYALPDSTNLYVQARMLDGSSPTAGAVGTFWWHAVA